LKNSEFSCQLWNRKSFRY